MRDKVYPKLRNVQGSSDSWTGVIYPLYGQNVDDFTRNATRIALAYRLPYIGFDITENGLIRIRAGQMPVPPMYGFQE